jgi:hypothetical protein
MLDFDNVVVLCTASPIVTKVVCKYQKITDTLKIKQQAANCCTIIYGHSNNTRQFFFVCPSGETFLE